MWAKDSKTRQDNPPLSLTLCPGCQDQSGPKQSVDWFSKHTPFIPTSNTLDPATSEKTPIISTWGRGASKPKPYPTVVGCWILLNASCTSFDMIMWIFFRSLLTDCVNCWRVVQMLNYTSPKSHLVVVCTSFRHCWIPFANILLSIVAIMFMREVALWSSHNDFSIRTI